MVPEIVEYILEKNFFCYYCIQQKNMRQSEIMTFRNNIYLLFVTTWVDLEGITFSEIRQGKTKYLRISFVCGI